MNRRHGPGLLVRLHRRIQDRRLRAIRHDDAKEPVGVDLVLELLEEPVERAHEPVWLVLPQLTQVEDRCRRLYGCLDEVRGKVVGFEQTVEGGVRRYDRLEDLRLGLQDDVVRLARLRLTGRLTRTSTHEHEPRQRADA